MLSPGMLILMDVTLLYLLMGPLVLFGLYVVFDLLGREKAHPENMPARVVRKDPALWSDEDCFS